MKSSTSIMRNPCPPSMTAGVKPCESFLTTRKRSNPSQQIKCVIVGGGTFCLLPEMKKKIAEADLILAADGGGEQLLEMGISPDYLIGDMDSISLEFLNRIRDEQIPIISYPSKKDYTDTELCIQFAREKGAKDITLMAVTGTRTDHTTANLFLLEPLCNQNISARIMDAHNTIEMLSDKGIKKTRIPGSPEDFLSILAVSEIVTGIRLKGVEYPLEKGVLKRGRSLGISNCFQEGAAEISIETGILLVFQSRD